MKHLHQLLQILADGRYHSGEALGKQLGITRSAIWKIFKQLPELGIHLNSTPKRGYCLTGGIELLDQKLITSELSAAAKPLLSQLEILETLPSTNSYLLKAAHQGAASGTVCLAEHQSAGRGRRGRQWQTPYGGNVALSILWRFENDPAAVAGLSLAIGVAAVRALQRYGLPEGLGLKWPNDVMWQGKKLAGILIELFGETHETTCVVLGLGLNITMPKQMQLQTDLPWVDIASIITSKPARNRLIALLLDELLLGLQKFQQQGLSAFLADYQAVDALVGKAVNVVLPEQSISGIAAGIDAQGELLIKMPDNSMQAFMHGEVSVRISE